MKQKRRPKKSWQKDGTGLVARTSPGVIINTPGGIVNIPDAQGSIVTASDSAADILALHFPLPDSADDSPDSSGATA